MIASIATGRAADILDETPRHWGDARPSIVLEQVHKLFSDMIFSLYSSVLHDENQSDRQPHLEPDLDGEILQEKTAMTDKLAVYLVPNPASFVNEITDAFVQALQINRHRARVLKRLLIDRYTTELSLVGLGEPPPVTDHGMPRPIPGDLAMLTQVIAQTARFRVTTSPTLAEIRDVAAHDTPEIMKSTFGPQWGAFRLFMRQWTAAEPSELEPFIYLVSPIEADRAQRHLSNTADLVGRSTELNAVRTVVADADPDDRWVPAQHAAIGVAFSDLVTVNSLFTLADFRELTSAGVRSGMLDPHGIVRASTGDTQ